MKTIRNRVVAMLILFMSLTFSNVVSANVETLSIKNTTTNKEYVFSSIAITNLNELKSILNELNLAQHTEVLQSMMMVETRAGTGGQVGLPNAHPSLRSYGVMQVTVPTARDTFRRFPELFEMFFKGRTLKKVSDKEIKKLLLENNRANMLLGIHVFTLYLDMVNNEIDRAIAGYNMGIGNALKRSKAPRAKYVQDVKVWIPVIALFNREYELAQVQVERVDIEATTVDNQATIIPIKEEQNGKTEETVNSWEEWQGEHFKRS